MPRPWLTRARPLLGKVSDHEIARRFGVARTIVSKARRELAIPPAPRIGSVTAVADRSWVPAIRHLLGKLPDREVTKRAGRSVYTVGLARRELGIARSQRRPRVRGSGKVPLTEALLRSNRTSAEISRMTGVHPVTISGRRRAIGVPPRPRPQPAWVGRASGLLGLMTEVEVARRAGTTSHSVSALRRRLGIPRFVPEPVRRFTPAQVRRALHILSDRDRIVFKGRFVTRPPRSLADIGRELGVSKQAVADRERRIRALLA